MTFLMLTKSILTTTQKDDIYLNMSKLKRRKNNMARETIQQYKARRRREIRTRLTIGIVSVATFVSVIVGSNMDIVRADARQGKMIDANYWDGFVLNEQATLIETCDGHVWEFDCPILDKNGNVLPVDTDVTVLFDGMRTENRTDDVPVMIFDKEGEVLR